MDLKHLTKKTVASAGTDIVRELVTVFAISY